MDYYRVLGVSPDASDTEIKRAYRALVKEVHPDTGDPGDVRRFRAIREAYEALTDPKRRRHIDRPATPVSWTSGFVEPLIPSREVWWRDVVPAHVDIVLSPGEAERGGSVALDAPTEGPCPACSGHGVGFFGWCRSCGGVGATLRQERVLFQWSSGVQPGQILTVRARNGALLTARIRIGG